MSEPEVHTADATEASRLRDDARLLVVAEEAFGHPRARQAECEVLGSAMEAMTTEQRDQRFEELRNELRRRLGHPLAG